MHAALPDEQVRRALRVVMGLAPEDAQWDTMIAEAFATVLAEMVQFQPGGSGDETGT